MKGIVRIDGVKYEVIDGLWERFMVIRIEDMIVLWDNELCLDMLSLKEVLELSVNIDLVS